MIVRPIGGLAALIVSAQLLHAGEALAGKFDGSWSMVAVTTKGHCWTSYIGLRIKRGRLSATSGSFAFYPIRISGRVSGAGRTSMKAIAGPRVAHGRGRFSRSVGIGTWKGRGPSGLCSGTWRATRL